MPCCPEQEEFREMIQSFARTLSLFEKEQISCYGLTPQQAYTLNLISSSPEMTMGVLSERLGIATSTLTRNIEKLEQEKIVARNRTSDDARAVQVLLTDEGRAKALQIQECYTSFFRRVLECIDPQDREVVLKAMRILSQALQTCRCC